MIEDLSAVGEVTLNHYDHTPPENFIDVVQLFRRQGPVKRTQATLFISAKDPQETEPKDFIQVRFTLLARTPNSYSYSYSLPPRRNTSSPRRSTRRRRLVDPSHPRRRNNKPPKDRRCRKRSYRRRRASSSNAVRSLQLVSCFILGKGCFGRR